MGALLTLITWSWAGFITVSIIYSNSGDVYDLYADVDKMFETKSNCPYGGLKSILSDIE